MYHHHSYSRKDIDSIYPPFLDKKGNTRKGVFYDRYLLIGHYLNGSYVYQNIDTAFDHRRTDTTNATPYFCVENKSPIEQIHVYFHSIITLHQEEVKKTQGKQNPKGIREMEQLIQIHDTVIQKTESLKVSEKVYLIFPGSMGVLLVGKNKFFRVPYDSFGNKENKIIEIASTAEANPFPYGCRKELSKMRDNKILLVSRSEIQLWCIETGRLIIAVPALSSSIIFCDFVGEVVFCTTATHFCVWRPAIKGETKIPIEVSEVVVSGNNVILGTMAGGVAIFNVENGELEDINDKETSNDSLLERLKTRVTCIRLIKDIIIVASQVGTIEVWSIVDRKSKLARKSVQTGGQPLEIYISGDVIYIYVKQQGGSEQIHRWMPNLKELNTAISNTVHLEKEVLMSGYLHVRSSMTEKWKLRYFRLCKNLLYMFKSHQIMQSTGTFLISKVSALEETSKTVVYNQNDAPLPSIRLPVNLLSPRSKGNSLLSPRSHNYGAGSLTATSKPKILKITQSFFDHDEMEHGIISNVEDTEVPTGSETCQEIDPDRDQHTELVVSELPADCMSFVPSSVTTHTEIDEDDLSFRGNDANSVKIKDKELRKRPHVANVNFEASREELSTHAIGSASMGPTPVKRASLADRSAKNKANKMEQQGKKDKIERDRIVVLTDSLGEASMNSEKPGKDNLNDSTVEVSDWDVGTAELKVPINSGEKLAFGEDSSSFESTEDEDMDFFEEFNLKSEEDYFKDFIIENIVIKEFFEEKHLSPKHSAADLVDAALSSTIAIINSIPSVSASDNATTTTTTTSTAALTTSNPKDKESQPSHPGSNHSSPRVITINTTASSSTANPSAPVDVSEPSASSTIAATSATSSSVSSTTASTTTASSTSNNAAPSQLVATTNGAQTAHIATTAGGNGTGSNPNLRDSSGASLTPLVIQPLNLRPPTPSKTLKLSDRPERRKSSADSDDRERRNSTSKTDPAKKSLLSLYSGSKLENSREEEDLPSATFKNRIDNKKKEKEKEAPIVGEQYSYFTLFISLDEFMYISAPTKEEEQKWIASLKKTISNARATYAWEIDFFEIEPLRDQYHRKINIKKGPATEVFAGLYNCQEIVVKTFHSGQSRDDFKTKVNLISALKHKNVLDIIGVCTKEHLAIVQPFVRMGSLDNYFYGEQFQPSQWTWKLYLKIASDIASALAYMHTFSINNSKFPILHKNLNLGNILLSTLDTSSYQTNIYVTNFGLGRLISFGKKNQHIAYNAPELLKFYRFSQETDVYSFGVILCELLTRKKPFDGDDNLTIINRIKSGGRQALPASAPPILSRLIKACWDELPDNRPTFSEILEVLVHLSATLLTHNKIHDLVLVPEAEPVVHPQPAFLPNCLEGVLFNRDESMKQLLFQIENFRNGFSILNIVRGKRGTGKKLFVDLLTSYVTNPNFVCYGSYAAASEEGDTRCLRGMTSALNDLLVRLLLHWSDTVKEIWKNRILYLFDEVGLMILESIFPAFLEITSTDTTHRDVDITSVKLRHVLVKLIHLLTKDYPVIMVLDNIHLATSEDLDCVSALFNNKSSMPHLFLIVTAQDPIPANCPFLLALPDLKQHIRVHEIELGNLSGKSVEAMVLKSLPGLSAIQCKALTEKICSETKSNPLLVNLSIIEAKTMLEELKTTPVADLTFHFSDEDYLLERSLHGLPEGSMKLLVIGACLHERWSSSLMYLLQHVIHFKFLTDGKIEVIILQGNLISLEIDHDNDSIEGLLKPAFERQILYKRVHGLNLVSFASQRLKQILYKRIPADSRSLIHFTIGQVLMSILQTSNKYLSYFDLNMYDTINHYLKGIALIDTKGKNVDTANLFLRTARKAKTLRAFSAGHLLLKNASSLLRVDDLDKPWEQYFNLAGDIWVELRSIEISENDGISWKTLCFMLGVTAAQMKGKFESLMNDNIIYSIFESYLGDGGQGNSVIRALKMMTKFTNTEYIVEEYRTSACNYIISNYFTEGLMDKSADAKRWDEIVKQFQEEIDGGVHNKTTVNAILEILKSYLRLLYYQMYNEMQQYETNRSKIEFYTWDLSKRFQDLLVDSYLYDQFRSYLKQQNQAGTPEFLLDFFKDVSLFQYSLDTSSFFVKKTAASIVSKYISTNDAKEIFPERYVKAILDNQYEPTLNLFSELLRNVEDRLEVCYKSFIAGVNSSDAKRIVEIEQRRSLAGNDPRFRFEELLFDYYLFVKFLGFLTRKQKHYYLMLYRRISEFKAAVTSLKKNVIRDNIIENFFNDLEVAKTFDFTFDRSQLQADNFTTVIDDVFKLLRKKLQVFYADFSEKNIRTSRNLSVIGPNPVAVKSVSNQVNVVNSSTSQITIPLPKDKVITNKLDLSSLSPKGSSVQNAGVNLAKYPMAQLRQKTLVSLALPENDYLRATFEAWLRESNQEGNLQFFYEVQKFKENDNASREVLLQNALLICQTYLGQSGRTPRLSIVNLGVAQHINSLLSNEKIEITPRVFNVLLTEIEVKLIELYLQFCDEIKEWRNRSKRNKKARSNSENAEQRSFGSSTRKKIKKLKDNSKKKKTTTLIYDTLQKIYDSIFISYEVIYKNFMDFLPDQSAKDQLAFCKECLIFKNTKYRTIRIMKEASTSIAKKYFGFGGGSLLLPRYPDFNVVIEAFETERVKLDVFDKSLAYARDVHLKPQYNHFSLKVSESPELHEEIISAIIDLVEI